MEISLIETNGYALDAKVEIKGQVFIVMDDISYPGENHTLGPVRNVEIGYLTVDPYAWNATFSGNPDHLKTLSHSDNWNYLGYSQTPRCVSANDYSLVTSHRQARQPGSFPGGIPKSQER